MLFEKSDLQITVIHQLRYRKSYFTVYAFIHQTQIAEMPIECIYLFELIALGQWSST